MIFVGGQNQPFSQAHKGFSHDERNLNLFGSVKVGTFMRSNLRVTYKQREPDELLMKSILLCAKPECEQLIKATIRGGHVVIVGFQLPESHSY